MSNTETLTTPANLSDQTIQAYRRDGFVHVPGIIAKAEANEFRRVGLELQHKLLSHTAGGVAEKIFTQLVNVWRQDERMKRLTLHPNVARVAEKLAGVDLRLWHDQVLIKQPRNSAPTEFHQDQPYWPHAGSSNPISCWIALCDVPVERGCMTFIPGSHRRTDLSVQNLSDARSLFAICPDLQWSPRVTVPLRAGDCTFHHGRCAHMATPNFTDEPRVAHVVIFTDAATTYDGRRHVVTDPLNLTAGQVLEHPMFPRAAEYAGE
jgi:ectoine hydroxylase-related dioxygenase (phytanoyl-CoA dioxygenase family)